jgi:hypothetical protein
MAATKQQNKQEYLLNALQQNRGRLQEFYREAQMIRIDNLPKQTISLKKG